MAHALPPFASLLKSRDVEDPVNVYVHRPLAYGFVWLTHRTSLTPNQITAMAMAVGIAAGGMWIWGTPLGMVAGGILLWASGILDGADGIMARAKNAQSEFGRALDGAADAVVAICTVFPAVYHLWVKDQDITQVMLMVPAIMGALLHIYAYDFYKESYLRQTRLDRGGEGKDVSEIAERYERLKREGAPWHVKASVKAMLDMQLNQERFVQLTNPQALREGRHFVRNTDTARIYRENNLGPMRLWAFISLCPHTYLMAICAMFDRLDVYLWIRLGLMNVVFFVVVAWQRRATDRTMEELSEIGATPGPLSQVA